MGKIGNGIAATTKGHDESVCTQAAGHGVIAEIAVEPIVRIVADDDIAALAGNDIFDARERIVTDLGPARRSRRQVNEDALRGALILDRVDAGATLVNVVAGT